MAKSVYFQGGTLVLRDVGETEHPPAPFRFIKERWRCEGYHYGPVLPFLHEQAIRDTVPRWQTLNLQLQETREPHDYQVEALAAWEQADHRGSIILPTGAGKTFIAIQAIHHVKRSTVVIAPTIDLLHQWYARLVNAFATEVGVYYGAEKKVLPLTVTTYHSAGDLMSEYGNTFKLIIFDEVHHLPAPSWGEAALMAPAPMRLGLTATYPDEREQSNGRWSLDELIGPIVYTKRIEDLIGQQLAQYRTQRVRVDLTSEERTSYDADHAIYIDFVRAQRLPQRYGPSWLIELMRLSTLNPQARRAFLARQRILRLLGSCTGKFTVLEGLLREYESEQILVFTEHNATVYEIARRYLVPAITHETNAAERKHILDGFKAGHYRVIATSRVLNEGVDVPEAKIAIVLGGTSGAREYIQRLGRVLRKVENRQAVLFEIIARKTIEEGKAQRRRPQREIDKC
ncbi:DEAD/DEAH box helicase [Ktedonosporobacter rubrisoli]|uniref:DEAD/DEAH box helicase n=1 Tax=Ktedonosporobacter rubrisoli TaxID=2509675 RepID=A0A4P6JY71_KTERU|nr:DEAD/DEAH box helicase [Ktedonosporobacter rubrisoli]QBD79976.1 DEAD/DEAH box helicase [Ktedonosporobacter rubrisoli]